MANLVYCRGCGKEIQETAMTCPECGAPQGIVANRSLNSQRSPSKVINIGPLSIREVGLAQRSLLWSVLATFGVALLPILILVVLPFQLYCSWRITSALQIGKGAKILWLTAMIIPFVNTVTLLLLNRKATRLLREAGIHVGFMGARETELPIA